jgi:hypothetical protein
MVNSRNIVAKPSFAKGEAMIALYPVADGFESRCLEGLSH